MDLQRRLEVVEAENVTLRERVRWLEGQLLPVMLLPVEWKLTEREAATFQVLVGREEASRDHILFALYSDRVDDPPEIKIVDVFICKLRKKLKPFGINIYTRWGQGYYLDATVREQYRAPQAVTV